jgi:hypothetical protein
VHVFPIKTADPFFGDYFHVAMLGPQNCVNMVPKLMKEDLAEKKIAKDRNLPRTQRMDSGRTVNEYLYPGLASAVLAW